MAENLPTVAVVVPVFNVGQYVGAALESVAAQTHPPTEVIVVDDASTDDTLEQVKLWLDRLPLRIIELDENIGCGAARSVATRAASADVIAPFDGDDVWLPHHLEVLLPKLVDDRTIVAVEALRWDGATQRLEAPAWTHIPPADRQAEVILEHNFLFSGSLHYRSALMKAGGPSPLRTSEDVDNWIRLIRLAGCTAVPGGVPTVLYRARPESLSANEGCVAGSIEMFQRYLDDDVLGIEPRRLHRLIRRRRARLRYVAALERAERGEPWAARFDLVNAAAADHSLHGWLRPAEEGSVTLRGLVAAVDPKRAAARRRSNMEASGFKLDETAN